MKLLVLGEVPQAVTFAQQWAAATGGDYVTVSGDGATPWDLVATMQALGCTSLAGAATSFGRDILAYTAGLLDLPMLSDVLAVESHDGRLTLTRPLYAGNVLARVRTRDDRAVYSVRTAAFGPPASDSAPTVALVKGDAPTLPTVLSLDAPAQTRPELTQARVVVSGGRPTRDAATFEALIGGLADKLGGAAGATRAAVDAEIAPNELQVGQTGKVVAPELYIAAGISGSIQHLAGMKDSKVIVAINTDPDAPIFEVADYGLVADLHQAIPELIAKL
ncbi:electron transfer flavoprotein subunit alpha/FixB family protein [Armatimonas rosea]|uniref:Electron transfer flavoprotein alpha subunit n=1 Tax=Armatimonas rosea TaxID=685828 RepID=A0A7W9SVE2_ARMRO|nr:electron transfer flavoprotein subunit alpha/FixB family protein [Armatimonas rosea]MBB6053577.1 electron transfer flavoprotein alpha subunit [Armatimonas rosea]